MGVLADTPQWVVDGKNYFGLVASFVGAFGLVWRYAIKPYLQHREEERKRALQDAALLRKGEITVALIPLQEQLRLLQTDVNRVGDKAILLGDAIHGANMRLDQFAAQNASMHVDVNQRLNQLTAESQSLHSDVRAHMEAEDLKGRT